MPLVKGCDGSADRAQSNTRRQQQSDLVDSRLAGVGIGTGRCCCRARSTRPSPGCGCHGRSCPPRLLHRPPAGDIATDRPAPWRRAPAPSRYCGPREWADAAVPAWGWGPSSCRTAPKRLDAVSGGDRQESIDAFLEAGRILLPKGIMQEHAHGGHAHALRPAQFLVDLGGIEAGLLPHLQLVDGVGRDIVAAHQPFLLAVPAFGLGRGPALPRALAAGVTSAASAQAKSSFFMESP